jgi:hypothetical protein
VKIHAARLAFMALPAQKLAALTDAKTAVKGLQQSARGLSERFWLLVLGGLLIAAVVVGRRLVQDQDNAFLAALDAAPRDDETPSADEDEAVRAAAAEPTEDWPEVSRRLLG